MASYGATERAAARLLERAPAIKRLAKSAYQRIQFLIHNENAFEYTIHPDVHLYPVRASSKEKANYQDIFFGYYDKSPWGPDGNTLLMHARRTDGMLEIVAVDQGGEAMRVLGATRAWNWQQGAMTQWSGDADEPVAIFNTVQNGSLGTLAVRMGDGATRFIPWPVQTLHPEGNAFLSLNYKRLHRIRPEYGYAPDVENFSADFSLDLDGLWLVDLTSRDTELLFSLRKLCTIQPKSDFSGAEHKVNHAMYSPLGTRFVFMHRWIGAQGKYSRLYVADAHGENLQLLLDERMISHYCWRDEDHLLAWARTAESGDRYYLINVVDGSREIVGEDVLDQYGDGHPSYSPDRRWIITDTYPDKARRRCLLLFNTATNEIIEVGRFSAPWTFDGANRCDLHPRWSPDGSMISIDSAHEGMRKSYILDVTEIVNS